MIQDQDVIPLLLNASPSFKDKLEQHYKDWGEITSLYLVAGDFARHIIDLHKGNHAGELSGIFDFFEKLHTDGDEHVRKIATIGFLEALQNNALGQGIDLKIFETYLKPETKVWWDKLNDFWTGTSSEKEK